MGYLVRHLLNITLVYARIITACNIGEVSGIHEGNSYNNRCKIVQTVDFDRNHFNQNSVAYLPA